MNKFENVRQRKLHKEQGENVYRRIISIKSANGNFVVKIDDSRSTGSNFGLIDPNNKNAATSTFMPTTRTTPTMTLQEAIEFANAEFQRSVQHEQFAPLAAGVDFSF
jgi:hypothetical protein